MLVEHTFVTTIPGEEAMLIATRWLRSAGFKSELSTEQSRRKFTSGVEKVAQAKSISELPQRVWIENDRQRITIAATIEYAGKPEPLHHELLASIATSLQQVMENGFDGTSVPQQWQQTQDDVESHAKKKRGLKRILLTIAIGLLGALLGMLAYNLGRK